MTRPAGGRNRANRTAHRPVRLTAIGLRAAVASSVCADLWSIHHEDFDELASVDREDREEVHAVEPPEKTIWSAPAGHGGSAYRGEPAKHSRPVSQARLAGRLGRQQLVRSD